MALWPNLLVVIDATLAHILVLMDVTLTQIFSSGHKFLVVMDGTLAQFFRSNGCHTGTHF